MDKNRNSREARRGVLSTSKGLLWASCCVLALILSLCLESIQPTASAQSCLQLCQQEYVQCLREGHGLICDDLYDACWESCT